MESSPLRLILGTFVPEKAVDRPELFAGRVPAVLSLAESLHDSGSIPIVFGHRGVGKTSLAIQHDLMARGSTELLERHGLAEYRLSGDEIYDVIRVDGGQVRSIQDLEAHVVRELTVRADGQGPRPRLTERSRKIRFGINLKALSGETERLFEAANATEPGGTPEVGAAKGSLRVELERYYDRPGARRLMVIFDEFDAAAKTLDIASWLHVVDPSLLRVAICGIAQDYHELVALHPSLERRLRPIPVPQMTREELVEVLSRAADALREGGLDLPVDPAAADQLAHFSGGFPWFMQFLGREAFTSAVRRHASVVSVADVGAARAALSTDRWGEKYEKAYREIAASAPNAERALRFIATNSDNAAVVVTVIELDEFLRSMDPEIRTEQVIRVLERSRAVRHVGEGADSMALLSFEDPAFRVFCLNRQQIDRGARPLPVGRDVVDTRYLHKEVEDRWRERWASPRVTGVPVRGTRQRKYVLGIAPFARELLVTHVRQHAVVDVLTRYWTMRGYDVLSPVVYDTFGLAPELEASRRGLDPDTIVKDWIVRYAKDARRLGTVHDWDGLYQTHAPRYYGWTQWIFLRLFAAGLVYRSPAVRLWCPGEDRMVSEVEVVDGACLSCGSVVISRSGQSWKLRTRRYVARLREDPPSLSAGSLDHFLTMHRDAVAHLVTDLEISREHRWGTPIPIVHCPDCGTVPVSDEQLPIPVRPSVEAALTDWLHVPCPSCGQPATRETATLTPWVNSSWYLIRCCDPDNASAPFAKGMVERWMPVSEYVGDSSLLALHLAFVRLMWIALTDLGLTPSGVVEPVAGVVPVGSIDMAGSKMSKSLGNYVAAGPLLDQFGADALRLAMISVREPSGHTTWYQYDLAGSSRFIRRVWRLAQSSGSGLDVAVGAGAVECNRAAHRLIIRMKEVIESGRLHLCRSLLTEFVNERHQRGAITDFAVDVLLAMLAPICPHVTAELWARRHPGQNVHDTHWPRVDFGEAAADTVTMVVQVNGKVRDRIEVPPAVSAAEAERLALASPHVQRDLQQQTPHRVVARPPRIVNILIQPQP